MVLMLPKATAHPNPPLSDQDKVYNYTHQALVLVLLRKNHEDAIKLADGERIVRLYKFFSLFYKVSKCPKECHWNSAFSTTGPVGGTY
ncbi:hypothetical protein ACROYT_G014378 [Oculina patagonica]